jgi:hypothetical protein
MPRAPALGRRRLDYLKELDSRKEALENDIGLPLY